MAKDAQTILNEIVAHIDDEGGPKNTWYSGITNDIGERLHGAHGVPRENHWFITRRALSNADARAVENALIDQVGTDGGPGGGDSSSVFVYSYKKAGFTNP